MRGMLGWSVGKSRLKDSRPPTASITHACHSKMLYSRLPAPDTASQQSWPPCCQPLQAKAQQQHQRGAAPGYAGFLVAPEGRGANVVAAPRANFVTCAGGVFSSATHTSDTHLKTNTQLPRLARLFLHAGC